MSKLDFVFGCRSPSSKYAWDGALVVAKLRGVDTITVAIFENGMDYTGHLSTYDGAVAKYREYTDLYGWLAMDVDDLDNTAINRDQIDDDTVLVVPPDVANTEDTSR